MAHRDRCRARKPPRHHPGCLFGGGSKEERRRRKLIDGLDRAQQRKRFDKALDNLAELIKLERRNPRWHHKRGDLLRRIGEEEEAIDAYDRAVVLYANQGLLARAVAVAKTILSLDPDRVDRIPSMYYLKVRIG